MVDSVPGQPAGELLDILNLYAGLEMVHAGDFPVELPRDDDVSKLILIEELPPRTLVDIPVMNMLCRWHARGPVAGILVQPGEGRPRTPGRAVRRMRGAIAQDFGRDLEKSLPVWMGHRLRWVRVARAFGGCPRFAVATWITTAEPMAGLLSSGS